MVGNSGRPLRSRLTISPFAGAGGRENVAIAIAIVAGAEPPVLAVVLSPLVPGTSLG